MTDFRDRGDAWPGYGYGVSLAFEGGHGWGSMFGYGLGYVSLQGSGSGYGFGYGSGAEDGRGFGRDEGFLRPLTALETLLYWRGDHARV